MSVSVRSVAFLLVSALLAFSRSLYASEPVSYVFSKLGTEDGLPNASVSGIVQDRTGYLWFGTQGGLVRYDGCSFKLFERESFNSRSLPHNQVQTLYLDSDVLWVGTYGGLARLDLSTETFRSYANRPDDEYSLSNDVVTSVVRDARGSIWVGTLHGLNRFDEVSGKFERFLHDPANAESLPCDIVRALAVDKDGGLWIGTSGGGLARFEYERKRFVVIRAGAGGHGLASDYVMSIDAVEDGSLWIGSWYGGLSHYDPSTGLFKNIMFSDDRVYVVKDVGDGRILVGTWGGGLFEYDSTTGKIVHSVANGAPGAVSHNVIYSILKDRAGDVWIGTNGGGVCRLPHSRGSFGAIIASNEGLPEGKVYAAVEDRRGFLWFGIYNSGLARYDPSKGEWRHYRNDSRNPHSLPNDIVNCLFEDSSGSLWVGTNNGLARYEPSSDSFAVIRPIAGRKDWLSSEIIFAITEDREGRLLLGTFHSGIDRWNRKTGVFEHFTFDPHDDSSLSDNLVAALAYDAAGRLWVGTNKGLNVFDGRIFKRYLYDPTCRSGISSDSVRTLFLDSKGSMWIGTSGGGLMRYEPETDSFVLYTRRDGLPGNTVVRILEDDRGDLWIATQSGIVIYDRSAGRFRSLPVYNEFENREFFSGAFKSAKGSLYFGVTDAILKFDPTAVEYNSHIPSVVLSGISSPALPDLSAAEVMRRGSLVLPWRSNAVRFSFAALDYRNPERNRYSYRLEGVDRSWSEPSAEREVSYVNLPGGRYIFRVRASNNDGLWNEEGLSIAVRVGYAPLRHPLAYVVYALLFGILGYVLATRRLQSRLDAALADRETLRVRLEETSARLDRASIVDALTGLPNRRRAEEFLEEAFSRAFRAKMPLSALMIDIDNFQSYNDRHGKNAGDECIVKIARSLSSCLERSTDLIARYGGEEFLVIMQGVDIEGARAAGEKARRMVEEVGIPRSESRSSSVVTVSVGCASMEPEPGQLPVLLVAAAEKALLAAKQRGRNIATD